MSLLIDIPSAKPPRLEEIFFFYSDLPVAVRLHIYSLLSASQVCSTSLVSRENRELCSGNSLWKELFERDKPHNTSKPPNVAYKQHYYQLKIDRANKIAHQDAILRGIKYNKRLNIILNVSGLATMIFGLQEISLEPLWINNFAMVIFSLQGAAFVFNVTSQIWDKRIIRCLDFFDDENHANSVISGTRKILNGVSVLVILANCFNVSPSVSISLGTMHLSLIVKEYKKKPVETGLEIAVRSTTSFCSRLGKLFQKILCCMCGGCCRCCRRKGTPLLQ